MISVLGSNIVVDTGAVKGGHHADQHQRSEVRREPDRRRRQRVEAANGNEQHDQEQEWTRHRQDPAADVAQDLALAAQFPHWT